MLELAIRRWKNAELNPYGQCCRKRHFTDTGQPIPDKDVCERERAWREYVRIRDNNPNFCKPHWELN